MTDLATLRLGVDSRPLRRGRDEMSRFSRSARDMEQRGTAAARRINQAFLGIGSGIAAAATAVLGFGAAFATISNFERAMSQVEAISGATGKTLYNMRDTAKELGSTTEFSATQAAEGLRFLSMAGFRAEESIQAIPAVLNLATAASMDLGRAADITSNIMSGFGVEASKAASIADVLAETATSSNTSVEQLGQAMSTIAPVSKSLGISMEETAAAIGVLGNAGIQGERAGTGLRGAFASLAAPTDAAKSAIRGLGVAMEDVNPETNTLAEIMGTLKDAGMGTADAMTIFGREAATSALAMADGAPQIASFTQQLEGAEGAATDMSNTMRDNLGGDMKSLLSAVEGLILAFGDAGLTAALRTSIQAMTSAVRAVSEFADRILTYGATAAALFAGRYAPAMAVAAARTIALAGAMGTLRIAIARTGFGLLVVGAGELVYQINNLIGRFESWGEAWSAVQALGKAVFEDFDWLLVSFKYSVTAASRHLDAAFGSALLTVGDNARTVFGGIIDMFNSAFSKVGIPPLPKPETGLFTGAIKKAVQGAEDDARVAAQGAIDAFNEATATNNALDQFRETISTLPEDTETGASAAERLEEALGELNETTETGTGLNEAHAASAQKIVDERRGLLRQLYELTGATDELRKLELGALDPANQDLQRKIYEIEDAQEAIEGLTPAVDGVSNAFGNFVSRGFKDFKGFTEDIVSSFQSMLSQMISMAARNRIMVSLGMGGGVAGGATGAAAQAAGGLPGGGMLSGLAGPISAGIGTWGGGLTGGLLGGMSGVTSGISAGWATGGLGGAISGGFGATMSGISGGLAAGGIGGIASAIGAAVPIIGAVVGFVSIGKKLFGGGELRKTKIEGAFDVAEGILLNTKKIYDGGWFRSDKTKRSDIDDPAVIDPLNRAFDAISSGAKNAARSIGLGTSALKDFSYEFDFSTKDMDEDQISQRLQEEVGKAADAMAEAIVEPMANHPAFRRLEAEGLGANEALQRLASNLNGVNSAFRELGLSLVDVSLKGANAADKLVQQFGSLENFAQASSFYMQNFYSDAERLQSMRQQINSAFTDDIGYKRAPRSMESFRDWLENARDNGNLTNVGKMLQLAPLFVEMTRLQESMDEAAKSAKDMADNTDEIAKERQSLMLKLWELQGREGLLRQHELKGLDKSNRELQKRIWAIEDERAAVERANEVAEQRVRNTEGRMGDALAALDRALRAQRDRISAEGDRIQNLIRVQEDRISRSQEIIDSSERLASTLADAATDLRSSVETAEQAAMSRQRARWTLSQASRGGLITESKSLTDALKVLGSVDPSMFSTETAYRRDALRSAALIESVQDQVISQEEFYRRELKAGEKQISQYEKALEKLASQEDKLDDIAEKAQQQVNAAKGVYDGVVGVQKAVNWVNGSINNYLEAVRNRDSGSAPVSSKQQAQEAKELRAMVTALQEQQTRTNKYLFEIAKSTKRTATENRRAQMQDQS